METLVKLVAAKPNNQRVSVQPAKPLASKEEFSLPARVVGAVLSLLFLLVLEFALIELIFTHA